MLDALLPERPLEEQLAGYVAVVIGGRTYRVPTLPRRANREWKDMLNERLGLLIGSISGDDPAAIMAALSLADTAVIELVRAYDRSGVIPPDDQLTDDDTDAEWLQALLQMAAAAYPFIGLAMTAARQKAPAAAIPGQPPGPALMNGLPANGAGAPST